MGFLPGAFSCRKCSTDEGIGCDQGTGRDALSRKNAPTKRSKNQLTFRRRSNDRCARLLELFQSSLELFAKWPLVAISAGLDMVTLARQAAITRNFRFGDGKPIILVPHYLLPCCRLPRCSSRSAIVGRPQACFSISRIPWSNGRSRDRRYYRSRRKEGGSDCAFDGHAAGGARGRRAQGNGIRCRPTRGATQIDRR